MGTGAGRFAPSDPTRALGEGAGPLGEAARLWEQYRAVSVAEAVASMKGMHELELTLMGKVESPLAATAAAVVLIRAQQWDLLHDWLRNLTDWFPYLPDGPVLRARQVMEATPGPTVPQECVRDFLKLGERGVPWTSETVGYAVELADDILADRQVRNGDRDAAGNLRKQLVRATARLRSGGLFTTYAAPIGTLTPDLIAPAKRPIH